MVAVKQYLEISKEDEVIGGVEYTKDKVRNLNEVIISTQEFLQERMNAAKVPGSTIMQDASDWCKAFPNILNPAVAADAPERNKVVIRKKFDAAHSQMWNECKIPSGFNSVRNLDDVDKHYSHLWLRVPGLGRTDTRRTLLLQDGKGNIRTWLKRIGSAESDACRRCNKVPETVGHVLSGCQRIPFVLLKERHDATVVQIANMVIKHRGLGDKISLSNMGRKITRSANGFDLMLDQRVWSKNELGQRTSQLPDIICVDTIKKRVTVLEVAVAAEDLIGVKQWEKEDKYLQLEEHLKGKYTGYKVRALQFVVDQLGILTKRSIDNLKMFRAITRIGHSHGGSLSNGVSIENVVAKILNVTLKGSLRIYSWFTGGSPRGVEKSCSGEIPEEKEPRAELPEAFQRKLLQSFSERSWRKTLTLAG